MSGGDAGVGIHGGVGVTVSGDDDVIGEPDGETEGDDGFGCVGQVICIYPYVPLNFLLEQWGGLWEDFYDILVSESRKNEPTVPWSELKAEMEQEVRKSG